MKILGWVLQILGYIIAVPYMGISLSKLIMGIPVNWKMFFIVFIVGTILVATGKAIKKRSKKSINVGKIGDVHGYKKKED